MEEEQIQALQRRASADQRMVNLLAGMAHNLTWALLPPDNSFSARYQVPNRSILARFQSLPDLIQASGAHKLHQCPQIYVG